MTLTELIAAVRGVLDEETTSDLMWTDTNITTWLNEANLRLASELEDLEASDSLDTVTATPTVALPTNFLRLAQVVYLSTPTNAVVLKPISMLQMAAYSGLTGTPEYYNLWAGNLVLSPTPAVGVTDGISLLYYKKPAALVAATECEHDSSLHYLLPYYACFLGYQKDMCIRESQAMKGYWEEGLQKAREFLAIEDRQEFRQIFDPGD